MKDYIAAYMDKQGCTGLVYATQLPVELREGRTGRGIVCLSAAGETVNAFPTIVYGLKSGIAAGNGFHVNGVIQQLESPGYAIDVLVHGLLGWGSREDGVPAIAACMIRGDCGLGFIQGSPRVTCGYYAQQSMKIGQTIMVTTQDVGGRVFHRRSVRGSTVDELAYEHLTYFGDDKLHALAIVHLNGEGAATHFIINNVGDIGGGIHERS